LIISQLRKEKKLAADIGAPPAVVKQAVADDLEILATETLEHPTEHLISVVAQNPCNPSFQDCGHTEFRAVALVEAASMPDCSGRALG
jgi:hypothetical protein